MSRATLDAIRFAIMFPARAAIAQTSIIPPQRNMRPISSEGAISSIIYDKIHGRKSSVTVPTIFITVPSAIRLEYGFK